MTSAHWREQTKDVILINAGRFFGRLSSLVAVLTLIGGALHAQEKPHEGNTTR
jgi:hypothetical protein